MLKEKSFPVSKFQVSESVTWKKRSEKTFKLVTSYSSQKNSGVINSKNIIKRELLAGENKQ